MELPTKIPDGPEDQAIARLLTALAKASLEADGEKVCLVIEDTLAKNWLQGQLKLHRHIFDHSFNTEIVKVSVVGLMYVLKVLFREKEISAFKEGCDAALKKKNTKERAKAFAEVAQKFAIAAATAAGPPVLAMLKACM
jgi:phenylpyruvate tautomerase PptA (4-oxalocrotonate tautomerase family)